MEEKERLFSPQICNSKPLMVLFQFQKAVINEFGENLKLLALWLVVGISVF